jgi:hypothetical protein
MARRILPALALLALVLTAQATPAVHRTGTLSEIPTDLHAFLLRANEPVTHTFSRTPAFTWKAVNLTGGHYQFQLATSRNFEDSTLVFKDANVSQPAETVTRQLPWLTGEPYALWARVRWMASNGMSATRWSKPFGFNVQWATGGIPQPLPAPEGLIRWTPIDGATAYEVLYPDLKPGQSFQTTTNVADEREFFSYSGVSGYTTIHWRVRAIRTIGQFQSSSNGLPAVSYGPWSPIYSTANAAQTTGTLTPTDTVSNVWDKAGKPGSAHLLTPGFAWQQSAPESSSEPNLYRVYVFSDKNCVNRIYTGSVVGGPAWAPRSVTNWVAENGADATGAAVIANEGGAAVSANKPGKSSSSSTTSAQTSATPAATSATQVAPTSGSVDLWDSGWPTGRFYWTVVPVSGPPIPQPGAAAASSSSGSGSTSGGSSGTSGTTTTTTPSSSSSSSSASTTTTYQDEAVPQDSCQAGDQMSFGKVSQPIVTSSGTPFLSGMSPNGRNVAAVGPRAVVFASPIAAWQPVAGATKYRIEMSRTSYPWHAAKTFGTPATSIVLPLTTLDAGTWYYRVRAINQNLPAGARAMDWSTPVEVKVTGNVIKIVR